MAEACRACDGRKYIRRETEDGFEESKTPCSLCAGTGSPLPPSKGGKRRFGAAPKQDDEELSMEEQTRAFLRKHGY